MARSPRAHTAEDVNIGHRIKIQRRAMGLSQADLGGRLGLTFQQVQKYEKGTNRVGAARLKEISRILEVSTDDLLGGSAVETSGDVSEILAFMAQPHGFRLARQIAAMTPGQCVALAAFLEHLPEPAAPLAD